LRGHAMWKFLPLDKQGGQQADYTAGEKANWKYQIGRITHVIAQIGQSSYQNNRTRGLQKAAGTGDPTPMATWRPGCFSAGCPGSWRGDAVSLRVPPEGCAGRPGGRLDLRGLDREDVAGLRSAVCLVCGAGSAAGADPSAYGWSRTTGMVCPINFWISERNGRSSPSQNEMASPLAPARPVRPMRCT